MGNRGLEKRYIYIYTRKKTGKPGKRIVTKKIGNYDDVDVMLTVDQLDIWKMTWRYFFLFSFVLFWGVRE